MDKRIEFLPNIQPMKQKNDKIKIGVSIGLTQEDANQFRLNMKKRKNDSYWTKVGLVSCH